MENNINFADDHLNEPTLFPEGLRAFLCVVFILILLGLIYGSAIWLFSLPKPLPNNCIILPDEEKILIENFNYKNHEYIRFESFNGVRQHIIHNPDCRCLK